MHPRMTFLPLLVIFFLVSQCFSYVMEKYGPSVATFNQRTLKGKQNPFTKSSMKPKMIPDILSELGTITTSAYDSSEFLATTGQLADELVAGTLNGLAGGAIGVMGTLFALEFKKQKVQKRSECPYCNGQGHLQCTACLATGVVEIMTADGMTKSYGCGYCEGTGHITCVNCKGDGRAVPLMLNRKASRDPESEMEDIGII
mmetsp:Transcript_40653/g.53534  ORF Transcript_40653/g.53534 Transcript_40653/m.53534 type:complete len:201 (-) Transcript_40653:242-844(-)